MSLKNCSVDILIPSLRPVNIDGLVKLINGQQHECEVNIITDTKTVGLYKAVNALYEQSKSEFIIHIPDDIVPRDGWIDNSIKFLKSQPEDTLVIYRCMNGVWEQDYHAYYGRPFSAFPCLRRSLIEKIGHLFDPNLKSFYGDPDLSLEVWNRGGRVIPCENAFIEFINRTDDLKANNLNEYLKQDEEYFKSKWNKVFGNYSSEIYKYEQLLNRVGEL